MVDIADLNKRHGIAGKVVFREGAEGFAVMDVSNTQATATIALQGAHLMTWAPRNAQPVIWLSSAAKLATGKSIRGGVPVCWPWFGPHASETTFPAHGFARTVPWDVAETKALDDDRTLVALRLIQTPATQAQWPHPCDLECRITVGKSLEIDLVSRNTGTAPFTIGDALHTYFAVSDIRHAAIRGLENCDYLDKVDGGKRKQQTDAVTFTGETDRIYLDTANDVLIDDPGLKRRIRIEKRGSRSTVVWNPWIEKANKMGDLGENGYLNMVCVETANAADDVVTVAPGAEHHLWTKYSVEPLGAA
jgi:glucose-6-phosphate 1-epimerase